MIGLFLDTADAADVSMCMKLGIIRGVTTNPTLLAEHTGDWRQRCKTIAEMIDPLPLSCEVTSNDPVKIMKQAAKFSYWRGNIVVKIPIHGPDGGSNLKLIHALEKNSNIRVNVTACMSAQQCMMATMAGATYVSLFGGRVANMGYNTQTEISRTRRILDRMGVSTKLIVGSVREVVNIIDWFDAGADIVTVPPPILEQMVVHPYTKETAAQFLKDAEKLK